MQRTYNGHAADIQRTFKSCMQSGNEMPFSCSTSAASPLHVRCMPPAGGPAAAAAACPPYVCRLSAAGGSCRRRRCQILGRGHPDGPPPSLSAQGARCRQLPPPSTSPPVLAASGPPPPFRFRPSASALPLPAFRFRPFASGLPLPAFRFRPSASGLPLLAVRWSGRSPRRLQRPAALREKSAPKCVRMADLHAYE